MTAAHTELRFEEQIVEHLAANGWLYAPDNSGYDKVRALYPADIRAWLEDTQPEMLAKVVRPGDDPAAQQRAFEALLDDIAKQLDTPLENGGGTLSVLRKPVRHRGNLRFDMCQAKPADSMNPTTMDRYAKVRLRVMRQVHYSTSRRHRSIDLVLLVNGLPIATIELKTNFTQSVVAGEVQYAHSRQPTDPGTNRKEPLLTFGARALVHFVVTNSVVSMTTKLDGPKTVFLPFNKGHNDKGGNPPNPHGSDTAYFWREVLQRDTWLTIVMKYMMVKRERKTDPVTGKKKKTSVSIRFPRYHQLDVVENLIATTREEGPGHRYLIEHSAGSGKTDSIAWTAHRLAALHDETDAKMFDSVIVVTDRTVLDNQIGEAMHQIEHKASQVVSIGDDKEAESKSKELAKALADRTPIVVVTIQTFPYALKVIAETKALAGRRFAVIADEAHSSQTGTAAAKLKAALSPEELADLEDGGEIDVEAILAAEMTQRAEAKNISYYAFTATPKAKTLELFGRPGADGKPAPFHRYTMSQAIDEGFILDVLRNYTPYKVAFKLVHNGQDYDSEKVDKSRALKSLMQWVRLHPHNIAQKVQIIVEHYRANIAHLLDGNAKAMVVTGSRKEAVRYQKALQDYIAKKGYDLAALVAFSGKVTDPDLFKNDVTEKSPELNPGLKGRDIAEAFNGQEYQVLIVANKFQVGFDQPLLSAMYVDKKLAGVMAVQTISRLNRTYPGKENVYILDFVNEPDDILEAFKPYYRGATMLETTDPNIIHRIAHKLDESRLYTQEHIDQAAAAMVTGDHEALSGSVSEPRQQFLQERDAAIEQDDTEELERLEMFRSDLGAYVKAYDFLSQIIDYSAGVGDAEMEKRAIFYRSLHEVISEDAQYIGVDLSGVVMTHYRVEEQESDKLDLSGAGTSPLTPLTGLGAGQLRDSEEAAWAEILEQINAIFEGTDLDEADQIRAVEAAILNSRKNQDLIEKAKHNTDSDFYGADDAVLGAFLKAAIEAQSNQSTATEAFFQERNRDRLISFLAAIGYREWLIGEKDPRR